MRRVLTLFTITVTVLAAGGAAAQTAPVNPGAPPPVQPSSNSAPNGNANAPAAANPPNQPQATVPAAAPAPAAPVAAQPPPAAPPNVPPVAPMAASNQPVMPPAGTAIVNPEAPLESGPQPVKGKWNPVLYGFAEFDAIRDSTESFNDFAGNAAIANPHSGTPYAGTHHRMMFGVRNSRLGFKLSAPESNGIKTTGIVEMDFLGNQPSNPAPTSTGGFSEGSFFASPTFRVRHMAVKLENPYVDVLLGQYWQLFGWQSYFHPNTVEIQGIPGQVFSRSPQARLSHVFKTDSVNVELAVAGSRPPQRDSGTPDGQAGIRVFLNQLKGVRTMGGAGTAIDSAAIGFSGVMRKFVLPEYSAAPKESKKTSGWGVSTYVMIPIPLGGNTVEDHGNSFALTGSWVLGRGIADLFTGLSDGNTASWALPNPNGLTPAPAYAPNIDAGIVEFGASGNPHAVMWQSFLGGIQYYLPPTGKVWVSLNYSHMKSNDIMRFVSDTAANRAAIYTKSEWYDANVFYDITVAARLGLEYAHFKQTFGDDTYRNNDRVQFSGWLIF